VLSLRERPFVRAARVAGASDLADHVRAPAAERDADVAAVRRVRRGVGRCFAEASLSFLGFGDPRMVSWGQMLYAAYISGSIRHAWWSVVPPGLCITLFTASVFLIGRRTSAS